ncbi:MAG: lysophospholipid acyltransferase family protein [Candidatus Dormibacteraeota bacterium]|nr:lysophospholipid acyltransferase family protein [Candidatus Dormibacteraeota bacterium]
MGARVAWALPPGFRYGLSGALGSAWWSLDRGRRAAILVNYGAALGLEPHDPEVARVAREAFANYGRMLADFLMMGAPDARAAVDRLTFSGVEAAEAALAAGRGAVLALPHMGSWDASGSLAAARGYPISAVAESFPGSLNDAVVATRSASGLRVIPLGHSAVRGINRALDENRLVALLCDLPPEGGGTEVKFLGGRAKLALGVAAIARKRGVPLLPVFARSRGLGRYHLHVDPGVDLGDPADGRTGANRVMQEVARRFEVFIRRHPDQWYAFKPIVYGVAR